MNCPKHNRPMLTEFTSRKEFCNACRSERNKEDYNANPFHVFGKGKSRKLAQRHNYENKKAKAKK